MVNRRMGLGAWRGKLFGSTATILVCLLFVFVGALPAGSAGQLKIRVDLVPVNVSALGACAAEEIYCESSRIGPYFPDFSLNRTTIRLKIEKICPRFPAFSLRSLLPRRLLGPEGRDFHGLSPDDFILLEEGATHEIVGFEATSRPFQLVLVIDSSNPVGQVSGPTSGSA